METAQAYVPQILFDWNTVLNQNYDKDYPLVLWDIVNSDQTISRAGDKDVFIMDVYVIGPKDETVDLMPQYDTLEAAFFNYLDVLAALDDIKIPNREYQRTLYRAGVQSVDYELGIKYRVTLEAWC